jgi:hypothetical protein
MRRVYNAAGGLGGNTLLKKGPVKGVAVSLARATTNSTGLTAQLFRNIEEAYADARIKGDLKDGCMPEPWQLLNADEVGFDPEGKFSKISDVSTISDSCLRDRGDISEGPRCNHNTRSHQRHEKGQEYES